MEAARPVRRPLKWFGLEAMRWLATKMVKKGRYKRYYRQRLSKTWHLMREQKKRSPLSGGF